MTCRYAGVIIKKRIKGDCNIFNFWIFKPFKNNLVRAKRSWHKDPLFCLVVILIISAFAVICFGLKSFSKKDFAFLKAEVVQQTSRNSVFAESVKNFATESPSLAVLGGDSAIAVAPPALVDTQVLGGLGFEQRNEIVEHIVAKGETIKTIAADYGISTQTILWANNLISSKLKEGQRLIIPPIDGVIYYVEAGDTLNKIAKIYKGEASEIIDFNDLLNEDDIFVGDILIIPNGVMPSNPKNNFPSTQIPVGSSYFIEPCVNCILTQGLHYYNAVDLAGKCGDPIFAAAGGIVQKVAFGWNGGGGNYIRVQHPNGVITYYGHVQKALVSVGQQVSQGDQIGIMGGRPGMAGAGLSTGCHVHFDVRGSSNPFAK